MNGVVVVDKPSGVTSHDVVQRVRRAIGQRSVGHAGTLDPLATGVLVVAVGEGTKLVSYLQADDKRYDATIALGTETDSLDADGTVTGTADVPSLEPKMVEHALAAFLGTHEQRAPVLSAIKVDGTPLHRRARRGEHVAPPVREVTLFGASVESCEGAELRLQVHCGKGFYVRSLARDLAHALGTVGHITALRRTASGPFDLMQAIPGDAITEEAVREKLVSLARACEGFRRVDLDESGVAHARHGRPIPEEHTVGGTWPEPADEALALFDPQGAPVAIARREGENLRVVRGFVPEA